MKIRKAYKFQLKPSHAQEQQMTSIAGHCRFLWNKVLQLNLDRLSNKQPLIWYHEADYWSKRWKASVEYGFLKEAPAHCLQQKLKDLDRAFRDLFDKNQALKKTPRAKKRGYRDSFRFPEPSHIEIDNRRIKLPKIGWMRFYKSQEIKGDIKNVTVSKSSGRWYISVQAELLQEITIHPSRSSIGLDVGIKRFVTGSDGRFQDPIHSFRQMEKRISKEQRKLAKKKKFSQNWKKQLRRVQKLFSKVANMRRDFLHKTSTYLSKSHALIVVEDLKITNMSASAKGTVDEPGRQVKAKSGLNKSILDQGWGEFTRQLEYKQAWRGGLLLKVNPQHTSQRCHKCGYTDSKNRQSQEAFVCLSCSVKEHADVNAARNILAAGHAVLACGEVA